MTCPYDDTEMELYDAPAHVHDPADAFGHGERSGSTYVCKTCGHQEEVEPDLPDTSDDVVL